jgi:hypothetical protein
MQFVNKCIFFLAVNPDWLEEWSYRDNYLLCRPDEITPNSSHKVWWKCKECGYIYKMAPKTRAMFEFRHRKPCPRCKGLRRKNIIFDIFEVTSRL